MLQKRSYYSLLFTGLIVTLLIFAKCQTNHHQLTVLESVSSPSDNPISAEKIAFGKKLFFDKRLSRDESVSCATCHVPEYAFTDRKKVSEGVNGGKTERNSPSLLNAGFLKTMMFDAHLTSLEMQAIVPIQEHVEMDMKMKDLIQRLRMVEEYQKEAKRIFNREVDAFVITRSIAAFERSLLSQNSRFDSYYYKKNKNALSKDERAGWKIFSEELYCTKCHPAPAFTTYVAENNGLYIDYGQDKGRFRIFNDSMDIGKFKVPSLRNIELTYPYMHDGSLATLDAIFSHYEKGGAKHPLQSKLIQPFVLTKNQREQLKLFLFSLTDTTYLKDFR